MLTPSPRLLGHAKLESTAIYTFVSIKQLKAVHAATHPSAKIDRPPQPVVTTPPVTKPTEHVAVLLATLDAEADDEDVEEPPH